MRDALKQLDMAALMGGPALRPALTAAITQVQTRLRTATKSRAAADAQPDSLSKPRQAADDVNDAHSTGERGSAAEQQHSHPAKRRRVDDVSQSKRSETPADGPLSAAEATPPQHRRAARGKGGSEQPRAGYDDGAARDHPSDVWPSGAAFTAAPPPDSLSGEAIRTAELPSLERREVAG